MNRFLCRLKNFVMSEEGPTSVEYALMVALIVVVCLSAITTLGGNANQAFTTAGKAAKPSSS